MSVSKYNTILLVGKSFCAVHPLRECTEIRNIGLRMHRDIVSGLLLQIGRLLDSISRGFFPTVIISTWYIETARKLWFHRAPGDVLSQNRQHVEQITKRRVVRMLIIVFTVFALCWLPGQVFQLLRAATCWAKNSVPNCYDSLRLVWIQ